MTDDFETFYKEICKTYFPRWKPWAFTYNPEWGNGGHTNVERKHIYFGNPIRDVSIKGLIIHEICHAVGYYNHNKRWQNRMMEAADKAKIHDPDLSAELIAEVIKYRRQSEKFPTWGQNMEFKLLYQRIEDVFLQLYSVNDPLVNVDDVLEFLLSEIGIRKEWDEKQFEKAMMRGRKIAAKVKTFL